MTPVEQYLDHLLVEALRSGASRIDLKREGSKLEVTFIIDSVALEMPLAPKRAMNDAQSCICQRAGIDYATMGSALGTFEWQRAEPVERRATVSVELRRTPESEIVTLSLSNVKE